jgi:hypothetical protein
MRIDIGPEEVLHRVEDRRARCELVGPGEIQVRLGELLRQGSSPEAGGEILERRPEAGDLAGGEGRDRREDPVSVVPLALFCGQNLGHDLLQHTIIKDRAGGSLGAPESGCQGQR